MINTNREAVAEILELMAEFYKFPSEEFYNNMVNGAVEKRLEQLNGEVALLEADRFPLNLGAVPLFSQYKQEYMRCLMPGRSPAALPVESIYKVWTTDPSAQLSIARQKGYLMGDSAIHINHLLEQFGLEVPKEYDHMPDHLTILLELLAFLIVNRSREEVALFAQEHFDWLIDFNLKLTEVKALPFFINLTGLLVELLEAISYKMLKQTPRVEKTREGSVNR